MGRNCAQGRTRPLNPVRATFSLTRHPATRYAGGVKKNGFSGGEQRVASGEFAAMVYIIFLIYIRSRATAHFPSVASYARFILFMRHFYDPRRFRRATQQKIRQPRNRQCPSLSYIVCKANFTIHDRKRKRRRKKCGSVFFSRDPISKI